MSWQGINRWLSAPFRAVRALFPFGSQGMATLIYLVFALAGPALTLLTLWAMDQLKTAGRWADFAHLADRNSWALMIIITGLAMFVSVRAVKLGPFEMSGFRQDDSSKPQDPPQP